MKETLLCALAIVMYFLVVWAKRKIFKNLHKPLFTFLGITIEVMIFIAFILLIALISGYKFNATSDKFTNFFERQGSNIVWTIVTIIIASTILGIMRALIFRKRTFKTTSIISAEQAEKRYTTMSKVIMSLINYLVFIICIIGILGIWGVDIMPALAGLGIAGLVIGLGAQKLIGDFVSGIFIVFEHHFDVGDVIEVGSFKGTVIDIGLKTTKIKNWQGRVKIIANSELTDLINDSLYDTTFSIEVSVSYNLNPRLVMEKLDAALKAKFEGRSEIVNVPHTMGVAALDDSCVKIKINGTTTAEAHYQLTRDILEEVKAICVENNFEIPYPQIVTHNGDNK